MKIVATVKLAFIILIFLLAGQVSFAVCVSKNRSKLRTGPSASYTPLMAAKLFTALEKVSKKGNWLEVKDVDGDMYWIYQTNLSTEFQCATFNLSTGRTFIMPQESAETHHQIKSLHPYDGFKVLETKGKWVKVEDGLGHEFWVKKRGLWIR